MDWLKNINNNVRVLDLLIPGTHNSCSYKLNPNTRELSIVLQIAYYIFPKSFIRNWVCCQELSIIEQLSIGVRFFDIRVSKFNEEVYTSHTYACVPLKDILNDIVNFLEQHPSEFIMIKFQCCLRRTNMITQDEIDEFVRMNLLG